MSIWFGRRQLVGAAIALVAVVGLAGAVAVFARPKVVPDRLWVQAKDDFEAKRFDKAEAKLAQLAQLREPTALDSMLRGEVAIAQNRIDDAVTYLERVPDDSPMAATARLYQGQLEIRRDRARKAEEAFLHALQIEPKLEQARRELVYIYGVQLRRDELRKQFAALSEQVRLLFKELFTWCLTLNVVWEPMESAAKLQKFVEADPGDRFSRLALAETLRQLQRLDDAEQVLNALPTTDADARATRVRVALDRNDEKAANALLADGPTDHGELARLRGRLAAGRHDWPAAVHDLRLAYAAEPDNRDTLSTLGNALRMVGDEQAGEFYRDAARKQDALNAVVQRAAVLRPQGQGPPPIALIHQLGDACAAANRLLEARAWYRLALARDPLDQEAQKGLFRIGEAGKEPQVTTNVN